MPRLFVFSCAFAIGWIVYMIAMAMTVYDGLGSMLLQSLVGAICSGVALVVAMVAGLIFQIPPLGRCWHATPLPAALLAVGSVVVLCFGSRLGLQHSYEEPITHQQVEGLRTEAALAGYFVLVFAIAHWPFTGQPRGAPYEC